MKELFRNSTYEPPVIGALQPWFGSKRNLAPEIVRELGPHVKYDEPCCGSCAVLLANALHRFKRARIVVSYYEHPALAELYQGWTKRRLKATKAMVNQGTRDKGGAVEAPEVLIINGPSYGE